MKTFTDKIINESKKNSEKENLDDCIELLKNLQNKLKEQDVLETESYNKIRQKLTEIKNIFK